MVPRGAADPVRFYCDADTLGLAKVLASLRADVTYPGDPGGNVRGRERPACPIESTDVSDTAWIRVVTQHGWAIITRDRRIASRPDELETVRATSARAFAITSEERLTTWHMLEIVFSQWRKIEELAEVPGPFQDFLPKGSFGNLIALPQRRDKDGLRDRSFLRPRSGGAEVG